MFHSLKAKFTIAFGTLIVLLFTMAGVFILDAKSKETSNEIASGSISFASFTVDKIINTYHEYLSPGNFIPFSRDISDVLRQNTDVSSISITSYSGLILYDSNEEIEEQYSGSPRTVGDSSTLERVQSINVSLLLRDGRVIYQKIDPDGNVLSFDSNEEEVEALKPSDRIVNIVYPVENSYAVIYEVNYDYLRVRLAAARNQIAMVAMAGLLLTLALSFVLSSSITNPIDLLKKGALRIATGDFKSRVEVKTKDEVGLLSQTFNTMAEQLEISTKALVFKERVAKELELAVQIQKNLLPKDKLLLPTLDIAGGLIPASEVGGDCFDYVCADAEGDQYVIYLGDVTGHGVAAGIVSSIVNSLIYALRNKINLIEIIHDVNAVIRKKITSKVFFTLALTMWNQKTRVLSYSNAGHPPVLYYDSATKKVSDIRLQGIALGMIDDIAKLVKTQEITLKPNDVFVIYSDGIVEANNLNHEQYGLAQLKRLVQDAADDFETAEAIKNSILSDVIEYIGGGEYLDDMTVVVLKGK